MLKLNRCLQYMNISSTYIMLVLKDRHDVIDVDGFYDNNCITCFDEDIPHSRRVRHLNYSELKLY